MISDSTILNQGKSSHLIHYISHVQPARSHDIISASKATCCFESFEGFWGFFLPKVHPSLKLFGRRTEWEKTIDRDMQCAGTHMVCRLGLNQTFCVALVSDLFLEYCTSCPLTHSVVGKHLPGLYFRFEYTHSLSLLLKVSQSRAFHILK